MNLIFWNAHSGTLRCINQILIFVVAVHIPHVFLPPIPLHQIEPYLVGKQVGTRQNLSWGVTGQAPLQLHVSALSCELQAFSTPMLDPTVMPSFGTTNCFR